MEKLTLKEFEQQMRAQPDCEEYTAEGKGFSIAYTAGKVTLALDA